MSGNTPAGRAIVAICRRLYDRGYLVATEGNVSVRLPSGDILVTGTRVRKREITARDLVRITPGGARVAGASRPSSEAAMHRFIYSKRRDVHAIVHAHPPYCTAFALAGRPLPVDAIPEARVEFGEVPLVPYAAPSTGKLTKALAPYVGKANFFLLANHGVVACAPDLGEAYDLVERAEHAARILLLSGFLGGAKNLTAARLRELDAIRMKRMKVSKHGGINKKG